MHVKRAYVSYLLLRIQSYVSKTATLGTEERGHCVEVTVMGRMGCNMTIFFKEYNMFTVLSSCLLSPIMVIIQC